jgi:hypothetical protein
MDFKELFDALGIDEATLRKMAHQMQHDPAVKKLYRQSSKNPGFNDFVDELYDNIEEVFKHDKSPDNGGTG